MRKLKLLMMACALLGASQTFAQTDVTSTYLTNADFESTTGNSQKTKIGSADLGKNSRAIWVPYGWTDTEVGTYSQYDASVLKSGDGQYDNISGTINQDPVSGSDLGSQTYGVRFYKNTTQRSLILYQSPTLPRGVYEFSAELISKKTSNMQVGVYYSNYSSLKQEISNSNKWEKKSISFTVTESRSVVLGIYFTGTSSSDDAPIGCADNIKLSYSNYTSELSSMIAKATALSNGNLASAIETAQGVLNNKDNTVAYQTTIDEAVETLQTAIISAQSADGSSLTPAIQNSGFEGGQSWYIKTTGADTYDVDGWAKASAFDAATYHYSCLATDQKSEGSQSFKVRFNWATASQTFTQTIPGLSLGRYTITADVKVTNGSKSSIDAYIMGNSTKGESVTATTSGFQTITAVVDLNEAGDLDIILGMDYTFSGGSTPSECIVYWDNITLTYNNPEDLYTSTRSSAQETYNNSNYANVTGDERTILYDLLNPDLAPSTVAEYFAAIDNINDAVAAFIAAKTNYDKYAVEAANATALGVSPVPALDVASNYSDKLKDLIVLEDAAVTSGYTEDATGVVDEWDVAKGELKTWTDQNLGTGNTDHWSGETKTYYNKYKADDGFTMSAKKTVSLPAGSYVLKAAARCLKVNGNDDFYLGVTVDGESLVKEVYTSTGGGSGLGIDKTGAANYTPAADTYANSNDGYGWEWRFVPFTLTETKDVELKITANILVKGWVSFSDIQLLTTSSNIDVFEQIYDNAKSSAESARDHANYTNVDGKEKKDLTDAIGTSVTASIDWYTSQKTNLDEAIAAFTAAKTNYNSLATAISNANTIVTNSINVGDGAFQVPTSVKETLATAKETAESTKSNETTTSADAATAASTLNTAISTYNTEFAAAELNEPEEGNVFHVMITTNDSYGFKNNPLTFNTDNVSGANFYKSGVAAHRAQQITFTKVSGNQYTLSMVNADGDRVYIRTNAPAKGGNGNTSQIRLTTTAENALAVQVIPSTTANGVYTLKNTEASALLGCQDADSNPSGGLYTVGAHNNFTITPASKPSISIDIASSVKLATRIFPFTPVLPSGVKAYSCEAAAGDVLTLVEVAEPQANTPYILYAEDGYSGDALTGYGTADKDNYTDGWLTGVYTETEAPEGSYVLQKQGDEVAFYQVDKSVATPSVGAYRCYLTTSAPARALYINFDETTAVETIKALTSGKSTIYNAAGAVVPSLQKGMNIIKMSDGSIRKVMVK